MHYVSTRGRAPELTFNEVLLTGLARDGGLYVPKTWPQLDATTIASFAGQPYHQVASQVMAPFIGDALPREALDEIARDAYARFTHPAVAPLVQVAADHWMLELFHGPTLAFKDVAMQVLAPLMDRALQARNARATIVGATSGDTGGAAIEAFRGRDAIDIFILFPEGRVSDVQRRQMTTLADANVHAIALQGTFDDCQACVKALFNDLAFRDRVGLAGVNSINWARIMAQVVYYFTAATALGAPARTIDVTVPTGNFGDIFAAYVAKRMGLPLGRLVVATNVNDILVRALAHGRYETADVQATTSPSMDIQVSSNFERLMFETGARDGEGVARAMDALKQSGAFMLDDAMVRAMREDFTAGRADEAETAAMIQRMHEETGHVVDPHTAIGLHVAQAHRSANPMVTLATAHAAKFPAAIEATLGFAPPPPPQVVAQAQRPERAQVLANDVTRVAAFIEEHTRACEVSA